MQEYSLSWLLAVSEQWASSVATHRAAARPSGSGSPKTGEPAEGRGPSLHAATGPRCAPGAPCALLPAANTNIWSNISCLALRAIKRGRTMVLSSGFFFFNFFLLLTLRVGSLCISLRCSLSYSKQIVYACFKISCKKFINKIKMYSSWKNTLQSAF